MVSNGGYQRVQYLQKLDEVYELKNSLESNSLELRRIELDAEKNLNRLARVLKDGAELRFASDHCGFISWSLERLIGHPAFTWGARSFRDWRNPPQDWVKTRYEEKALARQEKPAYLVFKRVARKI